MGFIEALKSSAVPFFDFFSFFFTFLLCQHDKLIFILHLSFFHSPSHFPVIEQTVFSSNDGLCGQAKASSSQPKRWFRRRGACIIETTRMRGQRLGRKKGFLFLFVSSSLLSRSSFVRTRCMIPYFHSSNSSL